MSAGSKKNAQTMSERWSERFTLFATGPAIVAIVMMIAASLAVTLGTSLVGMILVVLIGLALVLITLDTGSHSMAMFSGAFLLVSFALGIQRFAPGGVVPWTAAGVGVLAFADAIRLSFAQRRGGVVEADVTRGVGIGLGVVAAGSLATGAVVEALTQSTANVNWLIVPLALVLAVVGAVVLAVTVSKSPGQYDKRRWRPGERLLAPPREASDDPSFKSSVPPTPR